MRVIVIRFSSLGDCILLCPLLEHLKACGAEEVTIVTKRVYAELFGAARGVDRIAALAPGSGLTGLRTLVTSQRGRNAVVIDAHNNWRSRIVSAGLGGAETRIAKYYRERIELILFKERYEVPTVAARYSALGEALGLPAVERAAGGIEVPETTRLRALDRLGDTNRFVVIAPGSRWPMKQWDGDKFGALADYVATRHDLDIVLLGDAGDADTTARVAASVDGRALDLAGQISITECAAIIEKAVAFIGNDSGLMHLSEAVGTPVLALFGPTVEAFGYYPSLPASKVVERDIPCRPCSRNGGRSCPLGTQECLQMVAVEPVREAFDDLVAGRGPRNYRLN